MLSVPERWDMEVDLVAVGSSSGGLVAAIVGHDLGLSTVVLEKADTLGGGTAWSGGIWIPCNHHMMEMGLSDSRDEALMHIRRISMGKHEEENTASFLDNGPEMLRYIEEHTPLKMVVDPRSDWRADLPGGKPAGRFLVPDPLGIASMLMEAEKAQPFLSKVRRRPYVVSPGITEETWCTGRALIGCLTLACANRGIDIITNTRARKLIVEDGKVIGLRAEQQSRDFFVKAKQGVLLATGGFEWNDVMKKRFLRDHALHAFTSPSNEGDGHIMGMEVGAGVALMDRTIRFLTIQIPGEEMDGRPLVRPFQLFYPGSILVNRDGERCCNESFYGDVEQVCLAYDSAKAEFINLPIFWIADQSYRDKYPVGPLPVGTEMADWLQRASTVRELAERLGLPPDKLEKTVERFNMFARKGRDLDFHRGESTFDRWVGDRDHLPNPCLGPLERPPFYGIQVHPGTAGTGGGLVINANAQVINVRGEVIPGLYGTSNATAWLAMGSGYTSGFASSNSMVFGYLAALHLAQKRDQFSS